MDHRRHKSVNSGEGFMLILQGRVTLFNHLFEEFTNYIIDTSVSIQ